MCYLVSITPQNPVPTLCHLCSLPARDLAGVQFAWILVAAITTLGNVIIPMFGKSRAVRSAVVLFSAGLVLATCLVGAWLWFDIRRTIEDRTQTRAALIAWQEVYSAAKEMETATRGYVITRDDAYLDPIQAATRRLPRLLLEAAQAEKLRDGGLTMAKVEEMQKRVHALFSANQESITVTQREGTAAAIELFKEQDAKSRLDDLRGLMGGHSAGLDRRLRTLDAQMGLKLTQGGRALFALVVAALVSSGAAGVLLRQTLLQARRSERLAREKVQADRESLEKSAFLATMSHEIRTPMNSILGFGELLLADAPDEKHRRYSRSIVRSGQALLQLINDILDFSKIEAGMVAVETDPVDVRELADFVRQLFAHQCEERGITLEASVDDSVPKSLMLDAGRLRQILVNLVGNAIKFTPAGTVAVQCRAGPPDLTGTVCPLIIEVSDTGMGIPAAKLDHIFDPFVQAKANRDAELKGTGLGLAIVKRLTLLMGGTVLVRSEEGNGSVFTIKLPEVEISARLPQSITSAAETAVDFDALQPSVILVVDDNPENLAVMRGFFDGTHHTLVTAKNGREAIDWLESHDPPAVVLMDIRMPVLDGRSALKEIRRRANFGLLPVVAVTASSLAHEEKDLRAAFDGYVRKPFSRAQLFSQLAHFIPARPAEETPPEEPTESGPAPAAWRPLVDRLHELEQTVWPAVSRAMVLGEVTEFATELQRLAQSAGCAPLDRLATRLLDQSAAFSLDALEKTLEEFPVLIASLEEYVRATPP